MTCKLVEFGTDFGPQVPLEAECACTPERRKRKLPIWVQTQVADVVGRQLMGVITPDLVLFTYRCKCRRTIQVTLNDLFHLKNGVGREPVEV